MKRVAQEPYPPSSPSFLREREPPTNYLDSFHISNEIKSTDTKSANATGLPIKQYLIVLNMKFVFLFPTMNNSKLVDRYGHLNLLLKRMCRYLINGGVGG